MYSSVNMAYHPFNIEWAILRNTTKISSLWNKTNNFFCSLLYFQKFIIMNNLLYLFKSLPNSNIREQPFSNSMCWFWVFERESCINPNTNDQHSLSKLRHSIFRKIIQMRKDNITWFYILKILNNLLDRLSFISRQYSFYILCNKCFGLLCIHKP